MSEANPAFDAANWKQGGALERLSAEAGRAARNPGSRTPPGLSESSNSGPIRRSAAAIRLELHRDLDAIAAEWVRFETAADATPFQTFAWLSKWQRHIGARRQTRPAVIFGRDEGGELLFILPLAVESRGLARLTFLGSELCDYNAPLLAERFSREVEGGRFRQLWGEVVGLLRADPDLRFDLVDLAKMPERVGGQANPFLALPSAVNPSGAHVAALGSDWEAFYHARRSSSVRKQERKQFRRLGDNGTIQFVLAREPREVEQTLGTLFEQKSRSFARMGVEDIFARPGHREFFLDIATDPSTGGLAQVTRLDIGAIPAATNFGLVFRSCFYLVLSSYHDGELSRFGPGRAHLRETIRNSIEQGCRYFDFTIGDEPYKTDWSDTRLVLHDHLSGMTLHGRLAVAAARAFRAAKKLVKGNPALWRAYTGLRSHVGLAGGAGSRPDPGISDEP